MIFFYLFVKKKVINLLLMFDVYQFKINIGEIFVTCYLPVENVNLLIVEVNIIHILMYSVILVLSYYFHKIKHNNYNIII
jgi:hypothetical protein